MVEGVETYVIHRFSLKRASADMCLHICISRWRKPLISVVMVGKEDILIDYNVVLQCTQYVSVSITKAHGDTIARRVTEQ